MKHCATVISLSKMDGDQGVPDGSGLRKAASTTHLASPDLTTMGLFRLQRCHSYIQQNNNNTSGSTTAHSATIAYSGK